MSDLREKFEQVAENLAGRRVLLRFRDHGMYQMIANHKQFNRFREAADNGEGSFQDKPGNMIRCPDVELQADRRSWINYKY